MEKYDITANKLLDDDSELANKYADTNVNPYADQTIMNQKTSILKRLIVSIKLCIKFG